MIRKYLLVSLSVSAAVLAAAFILNAVVPQAPNESADKPGAAPTATRPETSTMSESCQAAGGQWLFEYGECEGANADWCSSEDGNFDECASACRHSNDPQVVCTMQCVPVCSFASETSVGEMAGPQLNSETATQLVFSLLGNCVQQNNCDKMEIETEQGADDVWRVTVIDRGLRDDSVKDKRTVITAIDTETGWRLEEILSEEYICQNGRGQTEFSPDLCL